MFIRLDKKKIGRSTCDLSARAIRRELKLAMPGSVHDVEDRIAAERRRKALRRASRD